MTIVRRRLKDKVRQANAVSPTSIEDRFFSGFQKVEIVAGIVQIAIVGMPMFVYKSCRYCCAFDALRLISSYHL